ncbi:hypothetical protein PK35_00565 [Tamlana nanhaiensis]|uniref:Serine kinase n=1 Tax=Neotamlana nanhaiensis TaxID=1382798 RepID=A0A0D7W5P5_9FLAO|nr:four-carbon acid sugar kinase family protein [Tamlana nanhaiensis]KJD34344.1 hypothetical protein PK35_00565 [Tamlana nanhaiensis]
MTGQNNILLGFYGDDFTGSTDALEFLTLAGLKTILFLKQPTKADVEQFPDIQAIGIAGKSRSMAPKAMEEELDPAFKILKNFTPKHVHYKVCSTFDSAPHVGNIGTAIAVGSSVFNQQTVFVSPSAPHLGRYCAFGNLFAKMGTAGDGDIYRIDQHPSMSKHPVTPALDGDLRTHLAKQTKKSINLIDVTKMESGVEKVLSEVENNSAEILFFDGLNTSHLQTIGSVFNTYAEKQTLFSVGSSGIAMALGLDWASKGIVSAKEMSAHYGENGPILVLSGSCSPVTQKQIEYAVKNGFEEIALPSEAVNSSKQKEIIASVVSEIVSYLKQGKSVVLHTSKGSNDPRILESEQIFKSQGIAQEAIQNACSSTYGFVLGEIAKQVLKQVDLKRILFAGGDTSSYAASELHISALEMIAPLAPGAPLCKAISDDALVNNLELNFKGGQVGTPDYFLKVLKGEKIN